MNKGDCIEKIAAKVVLATDRDTIMDDLTYLWDEAVREEGGLNAFVDEMVEKIARDLHDDAEFQQKFLQMKAESYRTGVKIWMMEHFGEWQGQELVEEMDKRIVAGPDYIAEKREQNARDKAIDMRTEGGR